MDLFTHAIVLLRICNKEKSQDCVQIFNYEDFTQFSALVKKWSGVQ
jgi:hypothetical protein